MQSKAKENIAEDLAGWVESEEEIYEDLVVADPIFFRLGVFKVPASSRSL